MNRRDIYRIVADNLNDTCDDIGKVAKQLFIEMKDRLSPVEILKMVYGNKTSLKMIKKLMQHSLQRWDNNV